MPHPLRTTTLALAAALLLAASHASGQSLTAGALSGSVRDLSGVPVAGALVTVTDASGGAARELETDGSGGFVVSLLAPGTYHVLVERIGFQPRRITGVPVGPGERPRVEVALTPAERAERVEESAYPAGVLGGVGAPGRLRLTAADLAALPAERRELGAVPSFSPLFPPPAPSAGGAGRGWMVDGVPFTAVRLPAGLSDPLAGAFLSFRSIDRAELHSAPADVEWSGAGGPFVHVLTRRGPRTVAAGAEGAWAAGSLDAADGFPSGSVSHSQMEGGAWAGGPLGAGGGFAFGADVRSSETPLQLGARSGVPAAALVAVAQDSFGLGLRDAPDVVRTDVARAFARLDASLGGGHSLAVRAAGAALVSPESRAPTALAPGRGEARGRDLLASAALASPLGEGVALETRLSFSDSHRDFAAESAAVPFALTRVVSGSLAFGGEAFPGRFARTAAGASATVHAPLGAHALKVGGGAEYVRHRRAHAPGAAGEFTFSDAESFAAGRGVYEQTLGSSPSVSFTVPRLFAFAQDTWRPAPGVALSLGARWEMEKLPASEIPLDLDWGVRTGMATSAVRSSASRISPRASLVVQPDGARWSLRAEGGLFTGESDPALLAEAVGSVAGLRVRRGVDVPWSWTEAPDSAAAPRVARTLTLLTPEWAPPREARAAGSLSAVLGADAAAHLAVEWRRSDFLPRRADLNLLPEPSGHDQHGRPLFGTLVQRGGVLAAEPGSNRRFADFDRVGAANLDGWLQRTAVTASLERGAPRGLRLLAAYTWSTTRDNLPGAQGFAAGDLPVALLAGDGDWSEGTSDFDVPHRAVAVAEWRGGGARTPALALVYRVRSGDPFTPGFRAGVDANGDGSGFNDPAFVDASVPGFADLASRWGCLQALEGSFAGRNACRGPTVHSLDARVGVDVLRSGAHSVRLTLDGLNLLGGERGPRDAALYLVDPERALEVDAEGRVVVPLLANPGFGEPLLRRATGRTLRIGLQLAY